MTTTDEWTLPGHAGRLQARRWSGGSTPTHVVLIAHGYGEHLGRYDHVADALIAAGAVVYALDHVGHGRSDGERVLIEEFEPVVDDLHRLDETARREHPDLPVVLLGHSMGGLIAARYAQRFGDSLAALVLSSPVLGRWDAVTQLLALDEIPDVPLDPSALSRDPAVGAAYAADPLVWHGPFQRVTLEALQRALDTVAAGPSLGGLPTLWIHGEDDPLVPLDGTRVGIAALQGPASEGGVPGQGALEDRLYPGARHELFNETHADEVLTEVVRFIRDRRRAQAS